MTTKQRRRVSPEQLQLLRALTRGPVQLSAFEAAFANVRYVKIAARRLEALGLITIELTQHPEAENLHVRRPGNRNVGVLVASLTPAGHALLDLEDAKARFAATLEGS